ncbi:MAG: hypothetical protein QM831_09235 [Kofleriaceae bacterium]
MRAAVRVGMTMPRQVLPNQFYLVTRRTTQRMFLMTPSEETDNAFLYCVAEAAERFQIQVLLPQEMSNHHHTVVFDPHGRIIEFTAHFHKMFAKCMNALLGRSENFWSTDPPSIVLLADYETVLRELAYTAANPVLSHLVERVDDWPGPATYRALLDQQPIVATRPRFFFREDGIMPKTITLRLTIPSVVGETGAVLKRLSELVALAENDMRAERHRSGRGVVGRKNILRQSRQASPVSVEPKRRLRPRFAAATRQLRNTLIRAQVAFIEAYQSARAAWLAKRKNALFPPGTYWLTRFAGAPASVGSREEWSTSQAA